MPVIIIGDFNIQTPKDNTNPLCNYMKAIYKCNQYVNKSTTKYDNYQFSLVKFIKSYCWHNRLLLVRSQNSIYCYIILLTVISHKQMYMNLDFIINVCKSLYGSSRNAYLTPKYYNELHILYSLCMITAL